MATQIHINESQANALLPRPPFCIPELAAVPNQFQAIYDSAYPQMIAAYVCMLAYESSNAIAAILQETKQSDPDLDLCAPIHVEPSKAIGALLQKIDESIADPEMYDDNEVRPTEGVVREIKELVQGTEAFLLGEHLPTATVRPFDGSIRITWLKESGSVRLVYSENPVERYIFHEEVLGGRSRRSDIDRDLTPRSLASWLKWLNSR